MSSTTRCRTLIAVGLLTLQLVGCGANVASLSDAQLQTQLGEAEAEWKVTGKGVDEKDAEYIPDPRIQASYKRVKTLRDERDARGKAKR